MAVKRSEVGTEIDARQDCVDPCRVIWPLESTDVFEGRPEHHDRPPNEIVTRRLKRRSGILCRPRFDVN